MKDEINKLQRKWGDLISNPKNSKLRIRDAAQILKVSEAELLSTKINRGVTYLVINNWNDFFQDICSIGKLMFLVRNEYAVHEIIENNYRKNIKVIANSFFSMISDLIAQDTNSGEK